MKVILDSYHRTASANIFDYHWWESGNHLVIVNWKKHSLYIMKQNLNNKFVIQLVCPHASTEDSYIHTQKTLCKPAYWLQLQNIIVVVYHLLLLALFFLKDRRVIDC